MKNCFIPLLQGHLGTQIRYLPWRRLWHRYLMWIWMRFVILLYVGDGRVIHFAAKGCDIDLQNAVIHETSLEDFAI